MTVHRAAERFVTEHPGVRTWSSFSAGPHYDPSNVSCGPVIGFDEHLVEPGAGFDWHAHRGVVIISWVLAGSLRHEDGGGADLLVPSGDLLVQSTGDGIQHRETNASASDPLRFLQITLLLDLDRFTRTPVLPERVGDVTVDVLAGADGLSAGDSRRGDRAFVAASSDARLLVIGW